MISRVCAFCVAALAVADCKGKPATKLTLTGAGTPSAAVASDVAALFEQLGLGKATARDDRGAQLVVQLAYELPPDDRGRLDRVLSKLGRGKVRRERVSFTVDVDPAAGDEAGKPEHIAVTLDPSRAERTLRSTGEVGGEELCSWEVATSVSLPDRITSALANSQFVPERPYHISTDDPELRPLVEQMRFLQRDRVSFVFHQGVDATPREFSGTASPDEFRNCSNEIFEYAEPWFLCALVVPSLCGWMKSHELVDD
ncbi:MAG TPA: hypothetical protein VMJ10_09370 [Kofleriaceae bacterium]|nr:hypothetical protein [Kofleriaceae bacterium]